MSFPVAVDSADIFGAAFGLKAIPVSFFVDEVGIIRLQGAGPSPEFLRQIRALLEETPSTARGRPAKLPSARSLEELQNALAASPADWKSRLALARLFHEAGDFASAIAELRRASASQPASPEIHFLWGLTLMHLNLKEAALDKLKQARDLDPANWRIRKQIWAIQNPEKFYSNDSPDYEWQRQELDREKKASTLR